MKPSTSLFCRSRKIRPQRGDEQALAEASRPAEKETCVNRLSLLRLFRPSAQSYRQTGDNAMVNTEQRSEVAFFSVDSVIFNVVCVMTWIKSGK
jgi:hypothetical protein